MEKSELSKVLTIKYPNYHLSKLFDVIAEGNREEELASKLVRKDQIYYKVSDKDYINFIHRLNGYELDSFRGFSFMGMGNSYIYNKETMNVIAKISKSVNGMEYYLAVG